MTDDPRNRGNENIGTGIDGIDGIGPVNGKAETRQAASGKGFELVCAETCLGDEYRSRSDRISHGDCCNGGDAQRGGGPSRRVSGSLVAGFVLDLAHLLLQIFEHLVSRRVAGLELLELLFE